MLYSFIPILLTIFVSLIRTDAAKILVVCAKDSGSHLVSVIDYILMLAERGHSVHLVDSSYEKPRFFHQNLTTITIFNEPDQSNFFPWDLVSNDPRRFGGSELRKNVDFKRMLKFQQELLDKIMQNNWDLVVVDVLFNPHGYAIALRLNAEKGVKFILMDTGGAINQIAATSMSLGRSLVTKPFTYPQSPTTPTDIFDPKRFTGRLYNVLISTYNYVFSIFVIESYLPTVFEFGATDFTYHALYNRAELMFTYMFNFLGYPISETHFLQNIGAQCPDLKKRTLPAEVKKFVDDPKSKGTIYVAFGSYVNWIMAPQKIVEAFGNTMERLQDYRFVFVNNAKSSPLPLLPNVLYLQWTDQIAVLNHPKTKIFITHGGFKSTKEGLCSETPLLTIPLFAEQLHNANYAVKDNYGRVLNKFTLDDDQLYSTLKTMLDDQEWPNRLKRLKSIFLDRPISSLDAAFHYTQRAIKQKHNFSKNLPISWNAYLYLEQILILVIAILFIK